MGAQLAQQRRMSQYSQILFKELSADSILSRNRRHMNWILKGMHALPEKIAMRMSLEFSSFVINIRVSCHLIPGLILAKHE
jgi:hypothetical protein